MKTSQVDLENQLVRIDDSKTPNGVGAIARVNEVRTVRFQGGIVMRMRSYFAVMLMPLALIWPLEAAARPASEGGLRDPNPQERQILMHYREVIGKVLDQFRSNDCGRDHNRSRSLRASEFAGQK